MIPPDTRASLELAKQWQTKLAKQSTITFRVIPSQEGISSKQHYFYSLL
jgi:hypothetical protein